MNKLWIAIFVTLVSISSLVAQQEPPLNPVRETRQQLNQEIAFARELLRQGNYTGAAAYMETIYEKAPENTIVINLLKQCYDKLGQHTKSITLLERYLKNQPKNITYHMALAESLAKIGNTDSAKAVYHKVSEIIGDKNYLRFQTMLQSMINNEMGEHALALIDSWRVKFNDSLLFAAQKGAIYLRSKEYQKGLDEIYPLLADTGIAGRSAESKFAEVLRFVDSRPIGESYLLAKADLYSTPRALKVLSDHYLRTDQVESAFDLTLALDSLDGFRGDKLFDFMRTCTDRKLFPVVKKMGDYIFENNPSALRYPGVFFSYGEALTELGEYNSAIKIYDSAFVFYKNRRDRGDALYYKGNIYFEYLGDYEKSYIYFDSVINHYRHGLSFYNSLINAPKSLLRKGELKEAVQKFKQASDENLHKDYREKIDYNLALIYFFEKKYDSSKTAFNKMLVDYPKGYFINDALKLVMTIEDAAENKDALYDYSNALLFEEMKQPDSTIYYLGRVAATNQPELADIALFRLMETYLGQNDTSNVILTIDKVASDFPESYYLPFCIKTKADIYLKNNQIIPAQELYKKLLIEYPNYPFISEVRDILRGLETDTDSA